MPTTNLFAVSHVTGDALTPNNALGAPDGVFTTDANSTASWTSRWNMGSVAGVQATGTHTITVRARRGSNSGTPQIVSITVFQNDLPVTDNLLAAAVNITERAAGADVSVTFSGALLNGLGNVSVQIATASASGNPSTRNAVAIDSITWVATYEAIVTPPPPTGPVGTAVIVPVADLAAARTALGDPNAFSIPIYGAGGVVVAGGMHVWDAANLASYIAVIEALPTPHKTKSHGNPRNTFDALVVEAGGT